MRFKTIALHSPHFIPHPVEEAGRVLKAGVSRAAGFLKFRTCRAVGFFSMNCKREMQNAIDFAWKKLHRN